MDEVALAAARVAVDYWNRGDVRIAYVYYGMYIRILCMWG